jgi:predicted phage tail protein
MSQEKPPKFSPMELFAGAVLAAIVWAGVFWFQAASPAPVQLLISIVGWAVLVGWVVQWLRKRRAANAAAKAQTDRAKDEHAI